MTQSCVLSISSPFGPVDRQVDTPASSASTHKHSSLNQRPSLKSRVHVATNHGCHVVLTCSLCALCCIVMLPEGDVHDTALNAAEWATVLFTISSGFVRTIAAGWEGKHSRCHKLEISARWQFPLASLMPPLISSRRPIALHCQLTYSVRLCSIYLPFLESVLVIMAHVHLKSVSLQILNLFAPVFHGRTKGLLAALFNFFRDCIVRFQVVLFCATGPLRLSLFLVSLSFLFRPSP